MAPVFQTVTDVQVTFSERQHFTCYTYFLLFYFSEVGTESETTVGFHIYMVLQKENNI